MINKAITITLLFILILACDKKSENENISQQEILKPKDSLKSASVQKPENDIQYAINVEKIDSVQFNSTRKKPHQLRRI